MAKLKAYTLGINGFISHDVLDVLGLPSHISQASVTVFAHSKAEVIAVLAAHSQQRAIRHTPKLSDPEFRLADGPRAQAFLGSWITEPAVIVTRMLSSGGVDPVARIRPDGFPEFWGVLRWVAGTVVFSPEQGPEAV